MHSFYCENQLIPLWVLIMIIREAFFAVLSEAFSSETNKVMIYMHSNVHSIFTFVGRCLKTRSFRMYLSFHMSFVFLLFVFFFFRLFWSSFIQQTSYTIVTSSVADDNRSFNANDPEFTCSLE